MEKSNFKNFGLIGCGAIARMHAQAIANIENAKLVGVYDYSYEFAQKFASEHNRLDLKKIIALRFYLRKATYRENSSNGKLN